MAVYLHRQKVSSCFFPYELVLTVDNICSISRILRKKCQIQQSCYCGPRRNTPFAQPRPQSLVALEPILPLSTLSTRGNALGTRLTISCYSRSICLCFYRQTFISATGIMADSKFVARTISDMSCQPEYRGQRPSFLTEQD